MSMYFSFSIVDYSSIIGWQDVLNEERGEIHYPNSIQHQYNILIKLDELASVDTDSLDATIWKEKYGIELKESFFTIPFEEEKRKEVFLQLYRNLNPIKGKDKEIEETKFRLEPITYTVFYKILAKAVNHFGFITKIEDININNVIPFLDYQLSQYNNDSEDFINHISYLVTNYKEKINPSKLKMIQDWIEMNLEEEEEIIIKDGLTTRQQIIIVYFLNKYGYLKLPNTSTEAVPKYKLARFLGKLLNRSVGISQEKVRDSSFSKKFNKVFFEHKVRDDDMSKEDLNAIQPYFNDLLYNDIVDEIKEILKEKN